MKVNAVYGSDTVYSSNVYLITGDWKRIDDVNTLIDVGSDPLILDAIEKMNTGIGKSKVEQVVLTHIHSDHTAALSLICKAFNPKVFAFTPFLEGVDQVLKHGDRLRIGDRICEVIHTPGHSSDSISLYFEEEQALFVGDTPVMIHSAGGAYDDDYYLALKGLCQKKIETIYFGHGEPVIQHAHMLLQRSLKNVQKSIRMNDRDHKKHALIGAN